MVREIGDIMEVYLSYELRDGIPMPRLWNPEVEEPPVNAARAVLITEMGDQNNIEITTDEARIAELLGD